MRKTFIDRVARICEALPECELTSETGQHSKLSVRGKTMGWHTVDHHGDGRVALTVRAEKGDNTALVASDPEKFFLPQYVAHHGYVGVYLDNGTVDWEEVRELVTDAYRIVAPKSLVKQLS
jgi:hypothetical protein